jgi:uncharacterized membrane protein
VKEQKQTEEEQSKLETYKMTLKYLVAVIFLFLFIPAVSATTFLNIYLDDTGNSLFLGETTDHPNLPSGVQIQNQIIQGQTQELTSKSGELWTFSYILPDSEITIILPEGSTVRNLSSNSEIYLDEDNRISILAQETITVSYTISNQEIEDNYLPIIIILFLISISVYLIVRKKQLSKKSQSSEEKSQTKKTKPDKLKILQGILSDREKTILSTLKKHGKVKSSFLRKQTDLPKASFSRHIQELEKKNLIKRSGEGRNKFIELKK